MITTDTSDRLMKVAMALKDIAETVGEIGFESEARQIVNSAIILANTSRILGAKIVAQKAAMLKDD